MCSRHIQPRTELYISTACLEESICYDLSNGAAAVYQLQPREASSCLGSADSCATVSHPTLHTYSNVGM